MFKHAKEFLRHIRNHKWERAGDGGLVIAPAKAMITNYFEHDLNGLDPQRAYNLITIQGLTYLLTTGFYNGSKEALWYLSLYGGNYTPTSGLTQASYPATASEITSGTEGYSNATRPAWTLAAPSAGSATNVASKAAFTIATASSVMIYGAALHSESTKGGVTGTCAAATKFATAREAFDTDVFNLGYVTAITSTD